MPADLLTFVEAAYDLEVGTKDWLRQLVEPLGGLFDDHLGLMAHAFDARDGQLNTSDHVFVARNQHMQDEFWASLAGHRDEDIAQYRHAPTRCALASDVMPSAREYFEQSGSRLGDAFGLVASCYDGTGWILMVGLPGSPRLRARQHWMWLRATAHVAAAGRLRRALSQVDEEAIFTPDGKCHHAEGVARPRSARDRLREAVRAIDRARSRKVESNDEALQIWRGLVEGRWTLVDHYDSDGRRFFVARPNAPEFLDPRALSVRERQVVQLAARGATNKQVAYELGLSASSVTTHLRTAMRKLDAPTRLELAQRVLGV